MAVTTVVGYDYNDVVRGGIIYAPIPRIVHQPPVPLCTIVHRAERRCEKGKFNELNVER